MSDLLVHPAVKLRGRVQVPGDKSISHRALLLAAVAEGRSRVDGFLPSADCRATLQAIRALGIEVQVTGPSKLTVHGRGLRGLEEPRDVLDCVRSGTTMRLLAGILAGQPFLSILNGDVQLRRRPMGRIAEPLRGMGATVLGRDAGRQPPLVILGGDLEGIDYTLPVASAQVKSAILLAGLYSRDPVTVQVPGPARDHTERMMSAMGARLETSAWKSEVGGQRVRLQPGAALRALDVRIPGDFSSAAFLIVAAALVPGSEITIGGVGVNPTRTGLLDILDAMGADLSLQNQRTEGGEPVADITVRSTELNGVEIGGSLVVRAIDEFPILAVAASQARGETLVRDAAELRVKETDRIATTIQELRRLGADLEARPDGFLVRGPTPLQSPALGERAPSITSHGDHRLAMALAVAGLLANSKVTVDDVDCIDDSFPGFQEVLTSLGGEVR